MVGKDFRPVASFPPTPQSPPIRHGCCEAFSARKPLLLAARPRERGGRGNGLDAVPTVRERTVRGPGKWCCPGGGPSVGSRRFPHRNLSRKSSVKLRRFLAGG